MENLDELVQKGIINEEQKERILAEESKKSSIKEEERKEATKNRVTKIFSIIGASLIGIGVITFIASNWSAISDPIKVLIIILGIILFNALGWYLSQKEHYEKTGKALFLIGAIIYGAGIFLIAQIYNVKVAWPDGLILWMLGAMLMAFVIRNSLLIFLTIILGVITIIGEFFILMPFYSVLESSLTLLIIAFIATFASFYMIYSKEYFHFEFYNIRKASVIKSVVFVIIGIVVLLFIASAFLLRSFF